MSGSNRREPVYDEYGELVGQLELSDTSEVVRVLDVDGYQVATTHSVSIAKRHLLNVAYNNKQYFSKPLRRR